MTKRKLTPKQERAAAEAAVIRVALAWWADWRCYVYPREWERESDLRLAKACARYLAAKKRKAK